MSATPPSNEPERAPTSAEPVAPAPVATGPDRASAAGGVGAGILGAAVAVMLVVAGWQWYDTRTRLAAMREEVARRLAEGDARGRETLQSARQASEVVRDAESKLAALENRLAESQSQQVALEALYQELARSRDDWSIAEVEQMLALAAQQLQLAGNVRAALTALQGADARLQRIDRPQLAALRKAINRDIERLQATPHVDVVGLSLRLDGLIASIDGLALAMELRPPAEKPAPAPGADEGNALVRFARDIWHDLRSLVRIQNVERPEVPLLTPDQAFFLRQNLKLRLLSARLALIQHDEKTFRADISAAREWIGRYYDTRDASLAPALATLRQLAEVAVGVDAPDINASLEAVRSYKLTREKALR